VIDFFLAATLLLLASLALLVYPVLHGRERGAEDRRGDAVALGRERLEALKRGKAAGEIDDAEYDEQVRDLEAQLADDLHAQPSPGPAPGRPGGAWIGIAVVVFIPVLSGLLYLALGQPRALSPAETIVSGGTGADGDQPLDVNAMVARLADRLKQNPDDAEGWFMLGRSYMVFNRYQEAADVFARVRRLGGNVPDVLVRQADAIAMTQGGSLAGEPVRLVQNALRQDPDHVQALWMAANGAYQSGDYPAALDYYRKVEPMLDGNSRQQVQGMIDELVRRGYDQAGAGASAPEAPMTPRPANGAGPSLKVHVALSPSLQDSASDQDTVYVFAKAVDGPPIPLAVVRKTVTELPLTVTLDDSQAMMPQLSLSRFEQVTVGARVSNSGRPTPQPGDLEGESPPVSSDTSQPVNVVIDRVVPDA
jgi:cytochrome c-type biogenesis protein CcmH